MAKQAPNNKKPSIFDIISQAKLAWKLFRDPNVSPLMRYGIPLIGLLYVLFPMDILPDALLGLGQLDDVAVLMILTKLFIELAPDNIVEMYQQGKQAAQNASKSKTSSQAAPQADDVIDVDYRDL